MLRYIYICCCRWTGRRSCTGGSCRRWSSLASTRLCPPGSWRSWGSSASHATTLPATSRYVYTCTPSRLKKKHVSFQFSGELKLVLRTSYLCVISTSNISTLHTYIWSIYRHYLPGHHHVNLLVCLFFWKEIKTKKTCCCCCY